MRVCMWGGGAAGEGGGGGRGGKHEGDERQEQEVYLPPRTHSLFGSLNPNLKQKPVLLVSPWQQ